MVFNTGASSILLKYKCWTDNITGKDMPVAFCPAATSGTADARLYTGHQIRLPGCISVWRRSMEGWTLKRTSELEVREEICCNPGADEDGIEKGRQPAVEYSAVRTPRGGPPSRLSGLPGLPLLQT